MPPTWHSSATPQHLFLLVEPQVAAGRHRTTNRHALHCGRHMQPSRAAWDRYSTLQRKDILCQSNKCMHGWPAQLTRGVGTAFSSCHLVCRQNRMRKTGFRQQLLNLYLTLSASWAGKVSLRPSSHTARWHGFFCRRHQLPSPGEQQTSLLDSPNGLVQVVPLVQHTSPLTVSHAPAASRECSTREIMRAVGTLLKNQARHPMTSCTTPFAADAGPACCLPSLQHFFSSEAHFAAQRGSISW